MKYLSKRSVIFAGLLAAGLQPVTAQTVFEDHFNDGDSFSTSLADGTVVNQNYWYHYSLFGETTVPTEVDGSLVLTSSNNAGNGLVLRINNRESVNGVDRRMGFLFPTETQPNPVRTFHFNGISIQGDNHPSNHLLRLMITSLAPSPFLHSSITVNIAKDGSINLFSNEVLATQTNRGVRAPVTLIPATEKVPGIPTDFSLTLGPTNYELTIKYDIPNGTRKVRDQDFDGQRIEVAVQGMNNGQTTYRGEHGITHAKWIRAFNDENTLPNADNGWTGDLAQDLTHPKAVLGSAIYISAANTYPSFTTKVPTVLTIDSITVTDGQ